MAEHLEDVIVNDIEPLIEINELMLDETADQNVYGKRLFALNCAIRDQLRNLKKAIERIIDEESGEVSEPDTAPISTEED